MNSKRTINSHYCAEEECLKLMKEKINSIRSDDIENRFQRLLLDHLISNGFYDTALVLLETSDASQAHSGVSQFSNEITYAKKVNLDILNDNFETALEWCNNNSTRLRKIDSCFEYRLKIHEMLNNYRNDLIINNLSQQDAFINAINYSRLHLKLPKNQPKIEECNNLLKTAMGLLTINSENPEYLKEFSSQNLQQIFQTEFSKLLKSNKQGLSVFQRICCTGLSSMKTRHCRESDRSNMYDKSQVGHIHGETNCPVCSFCFNGIQKSIPTAQISQSKLRDPVTGCCINEETYVMPTTKHIYGKSTIDRILYDKDMEKVVCPITGTFCQQEDLKRVFIMG